MKDLKMKKEFKVIADLLPNNTRVLDIGCGDGSLMSLLNEEKHIEVRGLELNQENVQECIHKGLPVIQGNAETELHQFPDKSFDYVVLSQTLQAFYDPEKDEYVTAKEWGWFEVPDEDEEEEEEDEDVDWEV